LTPLVYLLYTKNMPGRNIPLVTNEIYHIFNRGVASQPVFLDKRDFNRARESLFYYQNRIVPVRYSKFLTINAYDRLSLLKELSDKKDFWVEIIADCLMPNHFHLILKQVTENGISKFIANFTNSYTKYSNTKNERNGPIFQGKFKAVRVETNEQLLHLSRYIHLNPYTSFVVKSLRDLENYEFSSLPEYLRLVKTNFFSKEIVLDNFKGKSSYWSFVFDQADYQRKLEEIKHLTLEK
ncbi:hypothetical protein COY91_00005, partial [Candidatus Shapirobacteria bacterium CG_4_10_14_0_8_um_filter_39_15]